MRVLVATCLFACLLACRPTTPDEIVVDACADACENLRDVDCAEGFGSRDGTPCEVTCVRAHKIRSFPLACWAAATDITTAKACGALRCRR